MQQRNTLAEDGTSRTDENELTSTRSGQNPPWQAAFGDARRGEHAVTRLAAWVDDFRTGLARHDTFEIEAERLPALNAELRCIISVAEHALADARDLHTVEAPARDDVSVRSTGRLNAVGTESIVRTCEDIHHWLLRLRSQVEHALGFPALEHPPAPDPEPAAEHAGSAAIQGSGSQAHPGGDGKPGRSEPTASAEP